MSVRKGKTILLDASPLRDLLIESLEVYLGNYMAFIDMEDLAMIEVVHVLNRDDSSAFRKLNEVLYDFKVPSDVVKGVTEKFSTILNLLFDNLNSTLQNPDDYVNLEVKIKPGCMLVATPLYPVHEPTITMSELAQRHC